MPRAHLRPLVLALAALCLGGAGAGCGPEPPAKTPDAKPAAPKAKTPLEALADELDPGPPPPFWPTLPADVRAEIERTAQAPSDPAKRVAAAKDRLDGWALDFDASRPDVHRARIRAGLEGLSLAEPLALAKDPTPEGLAAAAVLVRFYGVLESVPKYVEWLKEMARSLGGEYAQQLALAAETKPLEMLAAAAPATKAHLSAKILRAGQPRDAVAMVLKDVAGRKYGDGAVARARDLYVEYIKLRGADATADDWLTVAAAHVRLEDRAAAADATARARALAAKTPGDRPIAAKLRQADADLVLLDKLAANAKDASLDARIDRVDLLRNLRRSPESATLVDELVKQHPRDARVKLRHAMATFEKLATAGKLLEGALYAADELKDPNLENKNGDYWSMMLGVAGVRAMSDGLPALARDPAAGAQKMIEIMRAIRAVSDELAKTQPGRAAAVAFLVDRAIPLVEKLKSGDMTLLTKALQTGLTEALALRARYPEAADVDRLVLTTATFEKDRAKAFEAVIARPRTAPEDDPALWLQRARTAVTLASVLGTPAALGPARQAVADVPPTDDTLTEAVREALLGDVEVLDGLVNKDRAAWPRAEKRYEAARKMHKEVRPRVTNNLGWIALSFGDPARADELFLESARDDSPRRWLAFLNAATAPSRSSERLQAIRDLVKANRGDGRPPAILATWLAAVAPDKDEAARAAREAIEELSAPLAAIKPDASALGLENEGSFQIGLGIASRRRFHELGAYAYGSLWLMPPAPLTRAELEAKAGPGDAKKPDPKKPDGKPSPKR